MQLKMPSTLKKYYHKEILHYYEYLRNKDLALAWNALERSHIIGQNFPLDHTYSHWLMLKFGLRIKNTREVLGQIPRLLFGGVKSFVGVVPVGNTGGADVPPLRPMKVPVDLRNILDNHKNMPYV